MPSRDRIIQIIDGTWYAQGNFDRDICCDCGLTHDTEYKLENGRLMFRTTVNTKETNRQRKIQGITVKRKP